MKSTTVKKDELLTKVRSNRETHIADSNKAHEAWRRVLADAVGSLSAVLQGDDDPDLSEIERLHLARPHSHVKDYDRVIAMLEMSTEDVITLDARDFGRYALDDWEWKDQWLASNRSYVGDE